MVSRFDLKLAENVQRRRNILVFRGICGAGACLLLTTSGFEFYLSGAVLWSARQLLTIAIAIGMAALALLVRSDGANELVLADSHLVLSFVSGRTIEITPSTVGNRIVVVWDTGTNQQVQPARSRVRHSYVRIRGQWIPLTRQAADVLVEHINSLGYRPSPEHRSESVRASDRSRVTYVLA